MKIEEVILQRQIDFNNGSLMNREISTEALQLFLERLRDNNNIELIVPIKIDSKVAFSIFSIDKELAKVFSAYLDVYHTFPLHPDLSFDAIWRSLEYAIKLYSKRAWNYGTERGVSDCFKRICEEVITPLVTKESDLHDAFNFLFNNVSKSLTNYVAERMLYPKQISVAPQIDYVKERAKNILPNGMLDQIIKTYGHKDNCVETESIHNLGRRLSRLVEGLTIEIGEKNYQPLEFKDRVQFLISIILYTSRCERFHGDVYSPFKSSISKLSRYYEYYYLTLSSMLIYWVIMEKLVERESHLTLFPNYLQIKKSIIQSIIRMNTVLNNK